METSPSSVTLLRRTADLVEKYYVLQSDAAEIAARLRTTHDVPDPGVDPHGFAQAATTLVRAHNGDRHLSVRHLPEGVEDEQDDETWERVYAAQARQHAGGVSTVGRCQDIATIRIEPYLSPVAYARPYLDAAMRLIDGVRFLVLDVRDCRGGTPDAVAHVCSYLLGPQPTHLQDVVARHRATERVSTNPERLDAPPQYDLPVAVLTSAATFSGGEDLAYTLQAFKRATVVGERTGGGAHPRQAFVLTPTMEVHVPVARSVNAVTGANWEGAGVLVDVPCSSEEAPARAVSVLVHTASS